ncbi:type VII secretion protein EccB [Saccharopolyspora sp. SCSIO 74807]|uniref:type VII secretion protein EccB n=2 Tax=Saccharopolyspora TaxID=1835 RepID=UPI0030CD288C
MPTDSADRTRSRTLGGYPAEPYLGRESCRRRMASTPTTKSQVQAYRFVLRRMESALVRKDAVMLHDPMGSHKRATVAGAILACIGIIGFLVWGLFGGKGSVPQPGSIVIGKDSGSVYVVTADQQAQKRLIPMLNMASAKLLVMAQGGGQGGQAVQATTVKEAALGEFPRGPRTGMVNAPNYLPDPNNIADPSWAICDVGQVADDLNVSGSARPANVETTVIGGDPNHGTELAENQSLFVRDQASGQEYLMYRVDGAPGNPNTRTVKAKVDRSERAVMDIYGLNGQTPRTISTKMLNAVPEVPELRIPEAPSGTVDYMQNSYDSGDVVRQTVAGNPDKFYVLLPSGKQEISAGAAAVLHADKPRSEGIPNATGTITDAQSAPDGQQMALETFPTVVPKPVPFQQADTSCLSWRNINGGQHITVTTNKGSPAKAAPVKLAQFDGTGPNVDYFYMPAGKAGVVRAAFNEPGAESGPIYLVSDQGVVYGVKDGKTAQGLGVTNNPGSIKAGPARILGTLPRGDFLDPAQASFVYDSIPVPPGGVNRPPPQAQQQSGTAGS